MDDPHKEVSEILVQIREEKEAFVFLLQGSLIYQTIQSAKEQIGDIPTDRKRYILDASGVSKIDSTGFGLILNMIKRIPNDSRLRVVIQDPFIKELFKVTKVDVLVDLFGTIEDAFI